MALASQYYNRAELLELGVASVGQHVFVSKSANLIHPQRIRLGSRVRIDAFSTLAAGDSISIGDHVHIGGSVMINAAAPVEIGNFSGISSGTKVFTTDDDYGGEHLTGPTVDSRFTNITLASVVIREHCIVGANSVILPGAELLDGVAVGALSLVKGRLDEWGVYGGVPAVLLKPRSRELLEMARIVAREEADGA